MQYSLTDIESISHKGKQPVKINRVVFYHPLLTDKRYE